MRDNNPKSMTYTKSSTSSRENFPKLRKATSLKIKEYRKPKHQINKKQKHDIFHLKFLADITKKIIESYQKTPT